MKDTTSEDSMVSYALGTMSREDMDRFETQLHNDPEFRKQFFQLQQALEQDALSPLGKRSDVEQLNYSDIKSAIFEKLRLNESVPDIPAESNNKTIWFWSTLGSIAAVAAVTVFLFAPFITQTLQNWGFGDPNGPTLVVYEIADGVSVDLKHLKTEGQVREVIYINHDDYDNLSRAEAYAEQLWNDYLEKKKEAPESISGRGFVVLDLPGKQGFAGFYEKPKQRGPRTPTTSEALWVSFAQQQDEVPVGAIGDDPGVFYFHLDEDKFHISMLNEFVPITKPADGPSI